MLKTDLHLHSKEDKKDDLSYSAKELIDKAAELKFDVLAFTFHHAFFWKKEIINYAKSKNILLIPGSEMLIEKCDVLVYNIKKEHLKSIKTFEDLRQLKKKDKNIFVIAPHPYFIVGHSMGNKLEKNIGLFDAIEISWFFTKILNLNKKAIKIAKKYNKPLIATSDNHYFNNFGINYSLVDSSKDTKAIFKAIHEKKIKNISEPRSMFSFIMFTLKIIFNQKQ